jgi:hypothetical protein
MYLIFNFIGNFRLFLLLPAYFVVWPSICRVNWVNVVWCGIGFVCDSIDFVCEFTVKIKEHTVATYESSEQTCTN